MRPAGAWGKQSLLGGRILELIRIRSAQLGECQPCMQSRKHDSITDEDVACLVAPGHSDLTEQERLAVEFLDLLSADHHAIDDEVYRELGKVFTAAQIVELGFTCANAMGLHRFIHTLDVFGTSPPVIAYDARPGRHRLCRDVAEQAPGMSQTVFVTGATGLAGANVCKLLIERGDTVRALARVRCRHRSVGRPWGSRSSPATSPSRRRPPRPQPGATPPSTAPRCWAGPARTWPTSRP